MPLPSLTSLSHIFVYFHLGSSPLLLSLLPLLPCACFFICLKPVFIYVSITFTYFLHSLPAMPLSPSLSLLSSISNTFGRLNSYTCVNGNKLKLFLTLIQARTFRRYFCNAFFTKWSVVYELGSSFCASLTQSKYRLSHLAGFGLQRVKYGKAVTISCW